MGETLITRLREACSRFGERDAVSFRPGFRFERWNYDRLWLDVCRAATMFRELGLQPGDRVLLWAPNCPQWVINFFGAIKAGAVMVPMDMRVSPQFVETVVERSEPRFAVISRVTPKHPSLDNLDRVYIEELADSLAHVSPDSDSSDESLPLAEILFKSGTTGTPKGVMLTHQNLIASVDSAKHHMPARPEDRLLSVLPLSHVFEQAGGLMLPLWHGASVTYATSRAPKRLSRLIKDSKPTTMLVVPQLLELLLKSIECEVSRQGKERLWALLNALAAGSPQAVRRLMFRSVHKRFGGQLERFICGGAAMNVPVAQQWERIGIKVVQGYGATEAAPTI